MVSKIVLFFLNENKFPTNSLIHSFDFGSFTTNKSQKIHLIQMKTQNKGGTMYYVESLLW